jgi:putative peptide zinc metalloprotease protein
VGAGGVSGGVDGQPVRIEVPFPDVTLAARHTFRGPTAPGEGDNQAVAINYGDGTSVFSASFSLVWVLDGVADNENSAWALASCRFCSTTALAWQLVLIVGDAEVVVPQNAAVALNAMCDGCVTQALARQLIITLSEPPSPTILAALAALVEQIEVLEAAAPQAGPAATLAELDRLEAEIVELLAPVATSVSSSAEQMGTTSSTSTTTGSEPVPAFGVDPEPSPTTDGPQPGDSPSPTTPPATEPPATEPPTSTSTTSAPSTTADVPASTTATTTG